MKILGIESSCDDCAAAVVENGSRILSNLVAGQIRDHRPYNGVVPEIASRRHVELIEPVVRQALDEAGISLKEIDGIAVTVEPGLIGSLLVGLSFAKAMAWSLNLPFIGINHIYAHLYAVRLEHEVDYPYIGLLVSGGHTIISKVLDYDKIEVLGTTIDDACGEAFDKVAKYYDLGFPGGPAIDKLSRKGNPDAFNFPYPSLHKGSHRYDVSYSGLKTAVINQLDKFWNCEYEKTNANIAASFQRTAIKMIVNKLKKAVEDTGIRNVVAGGGVAANSCLRELLESEKRFKTLFPSMILCTDNAAMIAGLGYQYLKRQLHSKFDITPRSRTKIFRKSCS